MTNKLTIYDKIYPNLLKQTYKPPQTLFYRGNISALNKPCISIVGTRHNTDYGQYVTEQIIKDLSILDIAIVSGLAKGIDTLAHRAALKYNLKTIAVLGSGINNIYPRENINLVKEIEKDGLILSEYNDLTPSHKYFFPQRNRIISGLSLATIIIEAPEKSGALITADFALEQGREVYVVPGDIDRLASLGCNRLLQKSAAYPITSGRDVIDMLKKQPHLPITNRPESSVLNQPNPVVNPSSNIEKPQNFFKLSQEEQQVLSIIPTHKRGITFDQLMEKSLMSISRILTALSLLELKGIISSADEKYRRT